MPEVLYPWGYAKRMVNLTELKRLARFDLMEPAYADRLEAWLVSRGGHIGIGGAFRTTQPVKPGFAPDGLSFHQSQTFVDGYRGFCAVDLVCVNGDQYHRAPRWEEVPRQGSNHIDSRDFGVHCNVNGEPWHMQPIEIDGHGGWVTNGRPRPWPNFPIRRAPMPVDPPVLEEIPTTPPPGPLPDPPPAEPVPPTTPQLPAISPGERTLQWQAPHMAGWDVLFVQSICKEKAGQDVPLDGYFDEKTMIGVRNIQNWFRVTDSAKWGHLMVDGVVGPQTWPLFIDLSRPPAPPVEEVHQVGSRILKLTDPPMNGIDVAWVQSQLSKHIQITVDGYYGQETFERVKTFQGWNGLVQDGVVGPVTLEVLKKI